MAARSTAYVPSSSLRLQAYRAPSAIARSEGRAASRAAGAAASPHPRATDAAKVSTSAVYAQPSPAYATTSPATAGAATPPTVQRRLFSATAAVRCSCATTRGRIASSAGRCTAASAEDSAATTYSGHTSGSGSSALTSRTALSRPRPASVPRISRRLSRASASAPPYSPHTSIGTSSTAPIAPTAAAEPVSSLSCTGSATRVRKLPKLVTRPASHIRR